MTGQEHKGLGAFLLRLLWKRRAVGVASVEAPMATDRLRLHERRRGRGSPQQTSEGARAGDIVGIDQLLSQSQVTRQCRMHARFRVPIHQIRHRCDSETAAQTEAARRPRDAHAQARRQLPQHCDARVGDERFDPRGVDLCMGEFDAQGQHRGAVHQFPVRGVQLPAGVPGMGD